MKKSLVFFLTVFLIVLSCALVAPVNAQSVTKNFALKHFNVAVIFPKTANPGDSILISVNAEATSSVKVKELSIQVLAYMESGDLVSVGSSSLASDQYVYKGNNLHGEFSVTVPTNIPRGALTAVVSETVRVTSYTYYYYPVYYYWYDPNYSSPYWYYPYYYASYPQSYSQDYVESKAIPGTYVLAITPEYAELKSKYDGLSSDYEKLSSKYNDLSVKYQQATEQNQQLNDSLSMTSRDLNNTRILAIVFIVTTVILAGYLLYERRRKIAESLVSVHVPTASPAVQPEKAEVAPEKKKIPKKTPES